MSKKKKGNGKNPAGKKLPKIEKRPVIIIGSYSSGMNCMVETLYRLITRKP